MTNMYVSGVRNSMQESAKKSKMLALFNTLEEKDKDIAIVMMELLVERSMSNSTTDMTTTPVAVNKLLTASV
jgi:hypothetical protein